MVATWCFGTAEQISNVSGNVHICSGVLSWGLNQLCVPHRIGALYAMHLLALAQHVV